jgi:4-hydroxy-tetrahydrodipicolinate synthase
METSSSPPRRLSGIWLPLITPFAEGVVHEASLARLAAHYAREPIDGFIVAATTGEGLVLDDEETERVVAVAAAELATRKPMFLGLCGSDTRRLAARIRTTAGWPIDGYLITCPYYSRPSQEGLYRHFTALAGETDRPILVYNIPYRTGVNLANDTLLRLAERENIVGVKDCCADAAQSFDLLRRRPPGFAVLTGEDALFYGALAHGADGGILASAHLDPSAFAAVQQDLAAGRLPDALSRWETLVDLVRLLFAEPNPAPIKHCLWRLGVIASPELRLPMTGVSPTLVGQLDRFLSEGRGASRRRVVGGDRA